MAIKKVEREDEDVATALAMTARAREHFHSSREVCRQVPTYNNKPREEPIRLRVCTTAFNPVDVVYSLDVSATDFRQSRVNATTSSTGRTVCRSCSGRNAWYIQSAIVLNKSLDCPFHFLMSAVRCRYFLCPNAVAVILRRHAWLLIEGYP